MATSEHLVGNGIIERGSSAGLGRSCPIPRRDDGAQIRSITSQPARQRQLLGRRAAHGGGEEGEHLGSVKSDSAHVAWLDVLT